MLHFQRWKVILILGIVIAGFLFALPNLFSAATVARLPTWLPHKQVNLGLDLQGGAHLLYQLDEKEMIEDWLDNIRGDVRETLRKDRIGYSDLAQNLDQPLRVGDDPRARRPGQGLYRAEGACRAGRRRRIRRLLRLRPRCRQDRHRRHADDHRSGPGAPHDLGDPGLDRNHQAPRRRLRHHRAQHSARGPQPRARAGPRHSGRRAPQDADRRDRQARIQAGRSRRRPGAGRHHQAGAGRRRARL